MYFVEVQHWVVFSTSLHSRPLENVQSYIINKQNVIKKRWLIDYGKDLEALFYSKVKNEIGDFKYDNLKTDNGDIIYGLFQESYNPIGLHIDGGFNFEDLIYKQTLYKRNLMRISF